MWLFKVCDLTSHFMIEFIRVPTQYYVLSTKSYQYNISIFE